MARQNTKSAQTKNKSAKSGPSESKLVTLSQEDFYALSAAAVRAAISARLGKSYGTSRDIYDALGYTKDPTFADYLSRYKRQGLAKTVINKPVEQSWLKAPRVLEPDVDESVFETAWTELVAKRRIYHYMSRVDKLAGVGTYAVLMLGVDDNRPFEEPLERATELLYLTPVSMLNAEIVEYDEDQISERFALPNIYKIKFLTGTKVKEVKVHHSRLIHIAEECLDDNVEGTPQLEAILNDLQNLDLVIGGGAEMFWRGAFPGYGFKIDENFSAQAQDLEALQTEIESYMHGLKRYLKLKGVTVSGMDQQLSDPSGNASTIIDLIAAATGIPKRILMGSERGELASSQDKQTWLDMIDARRRQHCEPLILRPFIDRLITCGILPTPATGYTVEWPDLMIASDKEQAEVAESRAKALKTYMESGGDIYIPPEAFLQKVMGFSVDDIEEFRMMLEQVDIEAGPEGDAAIEEGAE